MKILDFKKDGNKAWGEINAYGIIASLNDNYITLKISNNNIDDNQEVKNILQSYQDSNRISSYTREVDGENIFVDNEKSDLEYLGDLTEDFTNDFEKLQLSNTCSNCREESDAIINSCNDCTIELEKPIYVKINKPNNYIAGLIGAL